MELTAFLEAVAGALHTGANLDNQSTTTVAYSGLLKTLYVTSQGNKNYTKVVGATEQNFIKGCYKTTPATNQSFAKFMNTLGNKYKNQEKTDFNRHKSAIEGVKIIRDAELFAPSTDKSGFHGESRIIRFLVIKDMRGGGKLYDLFKVPKGEEKFNSWRKEVMDRVLARYQGQLAFGSSQGACQACADFLKALKLSYGKVQNINKDRGLTWLHPITLTTKKSGFKMPIAPNSLASNIAFQQYKDRL